MRVSGHPWNLPKQTNKGRIIHFESYQCVSKLREYRSTWISFQLANERKTLESFKCRSGPISSKTKKGAKVSTSSQHWKKKNWSYGAPNPPVPKASWWDPILGSHEAATCRQVHCQSPRSCRTCVGPHRKLQEIEGVLVDLGGANQHFVLL